MVTGASAARSADNPALLLFSSVVGQDAAVAVMRSAARRPVHAYLFVGSRGSGTTAAARAFAAALLCPEGGCGECDSCRRARSGTHTDLVVVERTGASIDVDDTRRLRALSLRRPREAKRQVLVVTDVHLASRAAPALLKTLEEPPKSTVFVLIADYVPPDLVTITSRCVEIDFPPVPTAAVAKFLVSQGVDDERARLVALGAGGDVDRARLLAGDPGYAARLALWRAVPDRLDGHGTTAGTLAREVLAAVERAIEPLRAEHAEAIQVLEADARAMGGRGLPGRKELLERQHREERRWRTDELRSGLATLAGVYRDRLRDAAGAGTGGPSSTARADPDPRISEDIRPDEVRGYGAAITLVGDAASALGHNAHETLLLEALFVQLAQLG